MSYFFEEVTNLENWDEFILNFKRSSNNVPQTTFIQLSNWKSFQESTGKQTFCFRILEQNKVVGEGLGVVIRAKRGKYLYFRNGPVLDWGNEELVKATIEYLKKTAKKLKLWFVRFSPLIEVGSLAASNIDKLRLPLAAMNDVEALDTYITELKNKTEESLMLELKKKVRYEVKKALKELTFEIYSDDTKLDEFYKILQETVTRKNWNAYSKEYIQKELSTFASTNQASLILAKYNSQYISAGIFIHDSLQTYYHYAASSSSFRELSAPYGVIWTALQEALKRGHEYFNFWGITPENAKPTHPWTGLTRFKMKFTGFTQRWHSAHDIPVSPLYYLTNTYERIDKSRKGY